MSSKHSKKRNKSTKAGPHRPTPLEIAMAMAQPTREAILYSMTPALRTKVTEIEKWVYDRARQGLVARYELGLVIKEVYDDENDNYGRVYGADAINKLRGVFDWQQSIIYETLRFVRTFSREQVEEMASKPMPSGQPLYWSHIRVLLKEDSKERRDELLRRTLEESWTVGELAAQWEERYVDKPEKRGRSLARPKHLDQVVRQQATIADNFLERADKVWTVSEDSLTAHYEQLCPAELTEERARQLKEHADKLRRLAREADARAGEADQVYEEFMKALSRKKAAEALRESSESATIARQNSHTAS